MSKLKIGYKNIMENAISYVFSVGTEDTASPFTNLYDNLIYDNMTLAASATAYEIDITLDEARTADYIAFYKSNLAAAGGTLKLQYWTGSAWADASSTITPADTVPNMQVFTSQSSAQWKLIIDNNNVDVTIADIKFGDVMTTAYGVYGAFTPPSLGRLIEYEDNKSDTGLLLGRSIKNKGFSSVLNIEFMADAYARSDWLPFIKHAELYPFYVAWNYTDYPLEVAYSVTNGKIGSPKHNNPGLMAVNLKITGYIE